MTSPETIRTEADRLIAAARHERGAGNFDAALAHQVAAARLRRSIRRDASYAHAVRHAAEILIEAGRAAEAGPLIAEVLSCCEADMATPPLDHANAVRVAAIHARTMGDDVAAHRLWLEARDRYAKLDQLFRFMTRATGNPGVEEAERELALLAR